MAIDPDVQVKIDALIVRIAALESRPEAATESPIPDSYVLTYPNGTTVTYNRTP